MLCYEISSITDVPDWWETTSRPGSILGRTGEQVMNERGDKYTGNIRELSGKEGMQKIGELVKDIRIAMMSTIGETGDIHSRPMATQNGPFNGTLWFLTGKSSGKVANLQWHPNVALDYSDPSHSKYITLRGNASVSHDRAKVKELWNVMYKAWFPNGEDDPEIAVLRVDVTEGEYWEASSSKIVLGMRYVAAAVTGGAVSVGEAGHVTVDRHVRVNGHGSTDESAA
jgi:general stress protein 26